ncbi:hypothetical protein N9V13_05040 [Betaproteobacteria bacterium]|nr:hypothetical protein [Betaproteobacteria bacterium]
MKRKIVFNKETIETLRQIKKIKVSEWAKNRIYVDQMIKNIRFNPLYVEKIPLDI